MRAWPDDTRLPSGRKVIRLVKRIAEHFPPNAEKPLPAAFRITPHDELDGKQRGLQPLFSVWDYLLISIADAKYNLLIESKPGTTAADYVGFYIRVDKIDGIGLGPNDIPVSVHRDPDTREGVRRGHAHAGIQGLYCPDKASKEDKLRIKAIRSQLIDDCERAPDDYMPECYQKPEPVSDIKDGTKSLLRLIVSLFTTGIKHIFGR